MLGTGPAAATTAATTSSNVSVLQQFASGLKSRNEETRAKAAKELQHYVTMELREVRTAVIGPFIMECWGYLYHPWVKCLLTAKWEFRKCKDSISERRPVSHVHRMCGFLCSSYTFLWHFLWCGILRVIIEMAVSFHFFSVSCHIPDLPLFLPDNSGWHGFEELVAWGFPNSDQIWGQGQCLVCPYTSGTR